MYTFPTIGIGARDLAKLKDNLEASSGVEPLSSGLQSET